MHKKRIFGYGWSKAFYIKHMSFKVKKFMEYIINKKEESIIHVYTKPLNQVYAFKTDIW